jgi:hypothetical protein
MRSRKLEVLSGQGYCVLPRQYRIPTPCIISIFPILMLGAAIIGSDYHTNPGGNLFGQSDALTRLPPLVG